MGGEDVIHKTDNVVKQLSKPDTPGFIIRDLDCSVKKVRLDTNSFRNNNKKSICVSFFMIDMLKKNLLD